MQIGNQTILTSYSAYGDDPYHYNPEWRHLVALSIKEGATDCPREFRTMTDIIDHVEFLKLCEAPLEDGEAINKKIDVRFRSNKQVFDWFSEHNKSEFKYYLEAALLTDEPLKNIAKDFRVNEDLVWLYSRLFFSVRSRHGNALLSQPLRYNLIFGSKIDDGMPSTALWKYVGITCGYDVLMASWIKNSQDVDTVMDRNQLIAAQKLSSSLACHTSDLREAALVLHYGLTKERNKSRFSQETDEPIRDFLSNVLESRTVYPTALLESQKITMSTGAVRSVERQIATVSMDAKEALTICKHTNEQLKKHFDTFSALGK